MDQTITVIEISENGISLLVGYFRNKKPYILSARRSSPLPLDPTTRSLDEQERKGVLLERRNKTKKKLSLGQFGATILLLPSENFSDADSLTTSNPVTYDRITLSDYNSCKLRLPKLRNALRPSSTLVSVVPYLFQADQNTSKDFPRNVKATDFTLFADIHYRANSSYVIYDSLRKEVGRKPYLSFFSAYAAARYRNFINAPESYILVERGERETFVSLIQEKRLKRTTPVGHYGTYSLSKRAAERLSLSPDKGQELLSLFGYSDLGGFPYQPNYSFSVTEMSSAFKDGLIPLADFLKATELSGLPVFLTGKGSRIPDIDKELSLLTLRDVRLFSSPVIGAKESEYLPCLGALYLSSLPYQPSLESGKKTQQQFELGKEPLKRE